MNNENSGEVDGRRDSALTDSSDTGTKARKSSVIFFGRILSWSILLLVSHDLLFISTQLMITMAQKILSRPIARDFNWRWMKCLEESEKPRPKLYPLHTCCSIST